MQSNKPGAKQDTQKLWIPIQTRINTRMQFQQNPELATEAKEYEAQIHVQSTPSMKLKAHWGRRR